ncbi:39S ribosomal protein L3, mitochondrial [Toxorhynchites rutilus septentrionalis]|uniref:39S ribosomal protein L3, mitochondrial n=1 Tax=Toxorhynchites rutilus septentrionalis TaxID=329112 RepID=UPI002479CECA|nr:39S ribosomal protein L3, mitochondrial [Toxorhynchites rutilus septentrionalis]
MVLPSLYQIAFQQGRIFSYGLNQVRNKNYLNRPRLRNPIWFVKKERTTHDELLTTENKSFVQEVLHDKYGHPALVKGILTFNQTNQFVQTEELAPVQWQPGFRRTGVIARKIGQYPLWKKDGTKIRTTLLQVIDNHVVKYIPPEEFNPPRELKQKRNWKSTFGCLLVGAQSRDPSIFTKEYCGLFKDSGVLPKQHLCRFIVSPEARLLPGTPLNVTHFKVGDYVDVRGKTIDHGFQGVVKRHGFKGMGASHGVTKTHRRPGNIGAGGEKARVWPGTKLPGHMGNRWRHLRGLRIWRINTKYNVMWVQGSNIAGETNGLIYIYDTILPLRKHKEAPAFPTHYESVNDLHTDENIWHEDIHSFKDGSIAFREE